MIDVHSNELEDLDSVSKRLKYIVDSVGVKQSHMADKLGVSPSGLHYILNNDVKFSKNVKKIAEFLNINEEWLATGHGQIYEENTSVKTYKIPIFYPDQLKLYYRSKQQSNLRTSDFYLSMFPYPAKAIGIYMTESNFAPKFETSDRVIFEQTEKFIDGEILLIYLGKSQSVVLKYAFHIGNEIVLISTDAKPMKLSCNDGDSIIGAYRECLKRTTY